MPAARYKAIVDMVDAALSKPKAKPKAVVHVSPSRNGWSVNTVGDGGRSKSFATKAEAVAAGRSLAREAKPARLVVHNQDGGVQDTFRYGSSAQ